MRHAALILLIALLPLASPAQGEGDVWCFGDTCRMDFLGGGSPIASTNARMVSRESSTSLSDAQGNLLFYANGPVLRNRFHKTVPGWNPTSDNYGPDNFGQGTLLLPLNDSLVWYSYLISPTPNVGIYMSLINPAARQDSGEVIAFNQLVVDSIFIFMGAVRHADGRSWWILSHELENDVFVKVLVSPDGTYQVFSQSVGAVHDDAWKPYFSQLVFSLQGDRFALPTGLGRSEIYHFDRCSGNITLFGGITKTPDIYNSQYGISFSPSGRYLYTSDFAGNSISKVFQYDLSSPNIQASEIQVGQTPFDTAGIGLHKLGPDGKIYIAYEEDRTAWPFYYRPQYLCVIENPDLPGTACNFVWNGYSIAPGHAVGLPNIPNYRIPPYMPYRANAGQDNTFCLGGDPVQIGSPDNSGGRNMYRWTPTAGLSDSMAAMPLASPSTTTTYYLTAVDTFIGETCGKSIDSVTVEVHSPVPLDAGDDQTICHDRESVGLGGQGAAPAHEWFWTASNGPENAAVAAAGLNPIVRPFATTTYTLHSLDLAFPGCPWLSDDVAVTVEDCPVTVPNVVTPNGDGINDNWEIIDAPPGTVVRLFDRWGNPLVETSSYGNDWPGNAAVPEGVYYWTVKPPKGRALAGHLTLLR